MPETLFRNAHVLVFEGGRCLVEQADVAVIGSAIAAVGSNARSALPDEVTEVDASGHLMMPGLVNAHFHSSVNHLKGSLDSLPLEIFMLYESPEIDAASMSPRAAYVRTMLGAAEMLKYGVTCVQDDAFFVPCPTPELIDAVMQAYADCGIRASLALDQPNVPEIEKLPFLGDILPSHLKAALTAPSRFDARSLLDCYDYLIHNWHGQENGRLRAAVSCSAPQRVTIDYFQALEGLSRTHGLAFYIHMLETKLQRVLGIERYAGRSLIRYVHDLGLLSERMNIIHAVWVDDDDLDMIGAAGSVIAHNPVSNLRLGSGVMPFRRMMDRQIPVCLGTDEAIADDSINMWLIAKMTGLIHNLTDPDYQLWPKAEEVLECLIGGGAKATRADHPLGRVAPGYQADLILVDLDTLPFTPLNDVARQLVYCELGNSVRLTMVAGEIVYRDGELTTIDEKAIRAEAREFAISTAAAKEAVEKSAAEWLPYYRQMYLKAAATPVGMNRWIGGDGARQ